MNKITGYALVLLALLAAYFASAYGYVSVGTNYGAPNYYYYSKGWVEPTPIQPPCPNIYLSNYYHGNYYGSCPSGAYYRLPELNPPLLYPYLTFCGCYQQGYGSYQSGSTANAYYSPSTAPMQAYLNAPRSFTYPPAFYQNSYQAALSYGNYGEQKYYLNRPTITPQQPQANSQPGYTYDYSGARWLGEPNYWYDAPAQSENREPTGSTFPPSFFIGYYSSGEQQQYYNQYQARAPQQAKRTLAVTSSDNYGSKPY